MEPNQLKIKERDLPLFPPPGAAALNPGLLVNREQMARALNVSCRTIDNLQQAKKIPFIKLSERCIRFYIPEVLVALQRFTVKEVK